MLGNTLCLCFFVLVPACYIYSANVNQNLPYRGSVFAAQGGLDCVSWTDARAAQPGTAEQMITDIMNFPDDTLEDASNRCRFVVYYSLMHVPHNDLMLT